MSLPIQWPSRWERGGAWDDGVRWETARTVEPTDLVLNFDYLANQVLRVSDASNEAAHISALMLEACEAYEDMTSCALMLQTWEMALSRFPARYMELQRPPFVELLSIAYVDSDGHDQTLSGSPADYLIKPSRKFSKARIYPLTGERFPATACQPDAVVVTYRAGYATAAEVPYLIRAGLELFIGERYKQRSLSVQGIGANTSESTLKLERFWKVAR